MWHMWGREIQRMIKHYISWKHDADGTWQWREIAFIKVNHRYSLSILLAIRGQDGGGVTVAADPANLILTGQEVLLLRRQTWMYEGNVRAQVPRKCQWRTESTTDESNSGMLLLPRTAEEHIDDKIYSTKGKRSSYIDCILTILDPYAESLVEDKITL